MKSLAIILLACFIALCASSAGPKPNVLYIVVDDLQASLGCFGDSAVLTPNIDRLVARGVRFDRAYCQFPLCNPSRTSVLSGRRPETSGAIQQEARLRDMKPDVVFLPGWFKQHGWFTPERGRISIKQIFRSAMDGGKECGNDSRQTLLRWRKDAPVPPESPESIVAPAIAVQIWKSALATCQRWPHPARQIALPGRASRPVLR